MSTIKRMCAAKIKDGLFVGDEDTSMSEVFINDNKISNLINLSGNDTPQLFFKLLCIKCPRHFQKKKIH